MPAAAGQTLDVAMNRAATWPQRIVWSQAERSLELVVQSREHKTGQIQFRGAQGFAPVDLDTVLET